MTIKGSEPLLSSAFEWYAQAFDMKQPSRVRKILLIEDEADLLAAMGRSFREAGLEVLACATFEEGREALRKQVARSCGTCAEHSCLDCTCQASARAAT